MFVYKGCVNEDGSCMFCKPERYSNYGTHYKVVYVLKGNSNIIRFCNKCKKTLIAKLKEEN